MNDDWRDQAACRGKPSDWWFPDHGQTYDYARPYCARCPVRYECLDFAIEHEAPCERHGMYGGLTPRERQDYGKGRTRWQRDRGRPTRVPAALIQAAVDHYEYVHGQRYGATVWAADTLKCSVETVRLALSRRRDEVA